MELFCKPQGQSHGLKKLKWVCVPTSGSFKVIFNLQNDAEGSHSSDVLRDPLGLDSPRLERVERMRLEVEECPFFLQI